MKLLITVLLTLLVVACSNNAKNALAQAHAESNPTKALEIIERAEKAEADACAASTFGCLGPNKILLEAENEYLIKAARSGNERALRTLYYYRSYGNWLAPQNELKTGVLERAKTSNNPDLLVAAANIYGNSEIGIINTSQRIELLQRAWQAGDNESAAYIANDYARHNNFVDAYLWSLRCISPCIRSNGVDMGENIDQIELHELEKHLNNSQIAMLQSKAVDRATITYKVSQLSK